MSYIRQFLTFLLNTTDKYVGNFGVSIIIVTILIKIKEGNEKTST